MANFLCRSFSRQNTKTKHFTPRPPIPFLPPPLARSSNQPIKSDHSDVKNTHIRDKNLLRKSNNIYIYIAALPPSPPLPHTTFGPFTKTNQPIKSDYREEHSRTLRRLAESGRWRRWYRGGVGRTTSPVSRRHLAEARRTNRGRELDPHVRPGDRYRQGRRQVRRMEFLCAEAFLGDAGLGDTRELRWDGRVEGYISILDLHFKQIRFARVCMICRTII